VAGDGAVQKPVAAVRYALDLRDGQTVKAATSGRGGERSSLGLDGSTGNPYAQNVI